MKEGRLHSVESMGTLDGPGVRTVFFMQGCNMRCLYCHNRDSWNIKGGEPVRADDILETVRSNRMYYGKKGGVTFSGGEPLLQSDFLLPLVKRLGEMGIHTALDTSGSVHSEATRRLFDLADLVILDIKHSGPERFAELCGFSDAALRANLDYLQNGSAPYWIRQVVVPGYTDGESQIDGLREMIGRGRRPERTELLPWHGMGSHKWGRLGEADPLGSMEPPSRELMDQLKIRLRSPSTESRK